MPAPAISTEAWLFIEVRDRIYRYRLVAVVTAVGSAEDNNVRIKEPSVAAHHLKITWADGHFHLRRVEEAAVHLNGERLETWSEELRFGDVVRIGDVRLRLGEGGSVSDVALLLLVTPPGGGTGPRPWQAWATRKREFGIGGTGSDLVLGGADGPALTVENFGLAGTYAMPVDGAPAPWRNDSPIERRTRLKDRDVLRVAGFSIRVRVLRGELMDDPEALLWPDVLKRFAAPEPHPG
jgi:pSer/pThr/pTyr-binding forkhead associated (FHA) protein